MVESNSFRPAAEPRPIFEWAFRACFGAFGILLIVASAPKLEGDTKVAVQGWSDIVNCIRSGHFAPCPTESYFAPLQTIAVTPCAFARCRPGRHAPTRRLSSNMD